MKLSEWISEFEKAKEALGDVEVTVGFEGKLPIVRYRSARMIEWPANFKRRCGDVDEFETSTDPSAPKVIVIY